MKRLLILAIVALAAAGCAEVRHRDRNPYDRTLFYEKYLNPGSSALDAAIARDITALRAQPHSAALHNDLGQLLLQKGFPKDAETEFERAVNADKNFYPAWYNLGLVREARGDYAGARFAYGRTVHYKPGNAMALFQLGLMAEKSHATEDAIDYYAKAIKINHNVIDVRLNPRVLDSKLIALALIRAYPDDHARESMAFQATPTGYVQTNLEAPSVVPAAKDIVTPAPPVTNPAVQPPPPQPGQPAVPQPQPATPPQQPKSPTVKP